MNMQLKGLVTALVMTMTLGFGTLGFGAQGANAASLVSCNSDSGDVTTDVSPTSSCFGIESLSDGSNQKLGELNALSINGTTGGWSTLGRFNATGSNTNFSLDDSIVAGLQGNWSIFNAATNLYGEFMMVFKSAQGSNTDPAAFVGYILNGTSGTWLSPFFATTGIAGRRTLSNVELYGRGDPSVIPLPAAGWLLLGGLGGLAALRRRRKAA